MKHLAFLFVVVLLIAACSPDDKKQAPAKTAAAPETSADSIKMAKTLHDFYAWYASTGDALTDKINFVETKAGRASLNEAKLKQYFDEFLKTGLVSTALVEDETRFCQACAALWKTGKPGSNLAGFDIDRYYCQNDAEVKEFQTAPVRFRIHGDRAKVKLMLSETGPNNGPREYEMKQENGTWLISKLRCNSGVSYK